MFKLIRCAARAHRQRPARAGWATGGELRDLEQRGLTMYGQMTAGKLDSTSAVRASSRARTKRLRRSAGATSAGRVRNALWSPPASAAWWGPAAGGDDERRRGSGGWKSTRRASPAGGDADLDETTDSPTRRSTTVARWTRDHVARSIACARMRRTCCGAGRPRHHPDVLTDQTSAHDALKATSRTACHGRSQPAARNAILRTTSRDRWRRWPGTCVRCWC